MFFNKRKIGQQQRREREKFVREGGIGKLILWFWRVVLLIIAFPFTAPYHAFFRKNITPGWKKFYKFLHLFVYALTAWTIISTDWEETAELRGEVYVENATNDYIFYFCIVMVIVTLYSLFKKKTSVTNKVDSSESDNKIKIDAEVDEVKEGFFEATIIVPRGTEIPDSSLESMKQQVRKSMEADGEEVIDVSIKILNAKKRSRTITQAVKDRVWNRDGGKCVQCGSNENLEFDHIIPFSKGGANTYRNIQLLCEPCNRSKSAKIG
jgi:hypothetical protein